MCNESSEQPLELLQHFEKCHQPKFKISEALRGPFYECYICKCQLTNRAAVREHLKQHVAARDTKCEICSERFTSTELEQWHICGSNDTKRSHISCEYCEQSFPSVAKCLQHLKNVHSDDQTIYRCRKCFASKCYGMKLLKTLHEKYRAHPVKKFQCDICSRRYVDMVQIRVHMRTHSNASKTNFCCCFCYSFCSKSKLTELSCTFFLIFFFD